MMITQNQKLNSLQRKIILNNESEFFISESRKINKDAFFKIKKNISYFLSSFQNKKIAIKFSEDLNSAIFIPILDGLVKSLLILPSDFSEEEEKELLRKAKVKNVLVDNELLIKKNKFVKYFKVDEINSKKDAELEYCNDTEWILCTSGTTGTPKLVKHSYKSLIDKIKNAKKNYNWVLTYSISRFAGLQILLTALLSNSKLIFSSENHSLEENINFFIEKKVNAISATPTMIKKFLMHKTFVKLNLKQITLGGEIVNQTLLNILKKNFSYSNISHIYASTEAGSSFSVTDGKAGFPKSFVSNNEKSTSIKVSSEGEMFIKSEGMSAGYVKEKKLVDRSGFVKTGDMVELIDDRYYFIGRKNGSINIGGNKVYPEKVEDLISKIENVGLVRVKPKKNSITGYIVSAEIVPNKKLSQSEKEKFKKRIRTYCLKNLEKYMVPFDIKIIEDLKINQSGKLWRK